MSVQRLMGWINAGTGAVSEALEDLSKSGEIVRFEDVLLHRKSLAEWNKGVSQDLP